MIADLLEGDKFNARVAACETEARASPDAYRRKVKWLTHIGYWLIPTIIAVFCLFAAWQIWMVIAADLPMRKLAFRLLFIILIGISLALVVPALVARAERAKGFALEPHMAPDLFSVIEEIRQLLGAPPVDRVLLTSEFNAAAAQVPVRIFSAKFHHDLVLGLPLLQSLDCNEMKSVIAHELGHFSGEHGRDGIAVWRTVNAWQALARECENMFAIAQLPIAFLIRRFVPFYLAHVCVLRRDHELAADRAEAKIVGEAVASRALLRMAALTPSFEGAETHFLHVGIAKTANLFKSYDAICARFAELATPKAVERNIRLAMAQEPDPTDSHPSVAERLAALGGTQELTPVVEPAITWLTPEAIIAAKNAIAAEQAEQFAEDEEQLRSKASETIARWSVLSLAAVQGTLAEADIHEYVRLSNLVESADACLERAARAVELNPSSAEALFVFGSVLAHAGDENALDFLEHAAHRDPCALGAAYSCGAILLHQLGRHDDAKSCAADSEKWFVDNDELMTNRRMLERGSAVRAIKGEELRDMFVTGVKANTLYIERAYLVEKIVPTYHRIPAIWLIVEPTPKGLKLGTKAVNEKFIRSVENRGIGLPPHRMWMVEPGEEWVTEKARETDGSLLWPLPRKAGNPASHQVETAAAA